MPWQWRPLAILYLGTGHNIPAFLQLCLFAVLVSRVLIYKPSQSTVPLQ